MSQFMSFDGLPLIVHDRILRSLPSPQDVANTIRASPGSLHAFVTGSRSILLSALKNFLSPENQHLMNLVMAARHICHHGRPDGFKALDFNQAVNAYIQNSDLRPLTLDTVHRSIRLYEVVGKAITAYNLFTLARSQHRVPKLSTPEASRWRYQFTGCGLRTPDEEETSRIWRGFLLYELVCIIHGVPQITDAASSRRHYASDVALEMSKSFRETPTYMREEIMCIQQYVQEQYDLAFNALVESFELAVGEIGRQALDTSTPPAESTVPIVDLDWETLGVPVQHLIEPPCNKSNMWSINMAVLGVSFLQRFLSWDESTRLEFIRFTYPFLSNWEECPIEAFLSSDINVDDLTAKEFGWASNDIDYSFYVSRNVDVNIQLRLRAVGWIFWENPDRLWLMSLAEGLVDEAYASSYALRPHLRLQGRPHLLEKSVEPEEWERVVRLFGPSLSESQLKDIKGLFKSIANLKSGSFSDVVSTLRCHHEGDASIEAQENDG
ncbi:hypothetical protein INS49_005791 [Diaporthe citri]|uniref:uncharacterized protein n=1 Tax=Diaporthe citri TaxID=83186 RepID=UPI001C827721|nr:uncharacterized protein INS49_005791 [Diaporthe citri]KAG6364193.1 hypothetical protein INS49_005791 [Diaporthe citri]